MYRTVFDGPLGRITMTSDGSAITGLWCHGEQPPLGENADALPVFAAARRWLGVYAAGRDPGETPPLAPEGTEFQMLIWRLLRKIPYGQTTSYGALAAETAALLGKERMSAQAVGGAVGRNPISILIPCHRVIGADRSLTGYGGGLPMKRRLLALEGHVFSEDGGKLL